MSKQPEPVVVASTVQKGIAFYVRRLRQTPVQDAVSDPEMTALARLDEAGPSTPSALARGERITPQGMGATGSELVRGALAERRPAPGDARLTIVSLTEAGRQVVRNKESARVRQLAGVLAE